ncbi:hypothetical protein VNO80_14458 [Phaseolus coccineus]|uniref:Uncharacterized protein n=1 Tax=Phaseolus coccineus TaxID=3886 RepID=A0AAN9MLV0_PHACN
MGCIPFEVGSHVTCGSKQVVLITILVKMFAINFTYHRSYSHICSSWSFSSETTKFFLFIFLSRPNNLNPPSI